MGRIREAEGIIATVSPDRERQAIEEKEMKVELKYGGEYQLCDTAIPVAVSRSGSTQVFAVESGYLEVQCLKSGRLSGLIMPHLPDWAS